MRAIEKVGLSKEKFKELYDQYNGFDDQFNKNHPTYDTDESFMKFLSEGSKKLVADEKELVQDIVNAEDEKNGNNRS